MTNPFTITAATNSLRLDGKRQAETTFTVYNSSGRNTRGRASLAPQNPASASWITLVGEAERDFPIAGTQQYTVKIAPPPDAPAGNYPFRLDVLAVDNPDEDLAQGPSVTFEVPAPEPVGKKFPWWILIVALVVLVVVGGVIAFFIFRPEQVDADKYNGIWLLDANQTSGLTRLDISNRDRVIDIELIGRYEHVVDDSGKVEIVEETCQTTGCSWGKESIDYVKDPLEINLAYGANDDITHLILISITSDGTTLSVVDNVVIRDPNGDFSGSIPATFHKQP
jgi:hypothetical protein